MHLIRLKQTTRKHCVPNFLAYLFDKVTLNPRGCRLITSRWINVWSITMCSTKSLSPRVYFSAGSILSEMAIAFMPNRIFHGIKIHAETDWESDGLTEWQFTPGYWRTTYIFFILNKYCWLKYCWFEVSIQLILIRAWKWSSVLIARKMCCKSQSKLLQIILNSCISYSRPAK